MSSEEMAESQPEVKDVSMEASAIEGSEAQATPPADASQTALEQEEQRVPYSRFKEVIEEKNFLGSRIAELESQLQQMAESNQGPSAYEKALERFRKQGLDENAARVLADSVQEVASEIAEKRVSPIEQQAALRDTMSMVDQFSEANPGAEKYVPLMMDILESYPKQTQMLIAADPVGLDLLYAKAKEFMVDEAIDQARQEGIEMGQQNLNAKRALSGANGRGTARVESMPDPEDLMNMSDEEYMKVRKLVTSPKYSEYVAKKRKGG